MTLIFLALCLPLSPSVFHSLPHPTHISFSPYLSLPLLLSFLSFPFLSFPHSLLLSFSVALSISLYVSLSIYISLTLCLSHSPSLSPSIYTAFLLYLLHLLLNYLQNDFTVIPWGHERKIDKSHGWQFWSTDDRSFRTVPTVPEFPRGIWGPRSLCSSAPETQQERKR